MSQTKEISLSEALDLAVAKLPPLRRKVTERRLKNAKYREAVLDELAVSLSEDEECPCRAILQGPSFTPQGKFQIDLDNLERFLQIIIKYLPTILELVLKFLPLILSFMLAMLALRN